MSTELALVGLVVVLAVAVLATLVSARRVRVSRMRGAGAEAAANTDLAESRFAVPGMVCEGCAEKITDTLKTMPGIREIKPKVPQKQLVVRYEPARVRASDIQGALAAAGFKAVEA